MREAALAAETGGRAGHWTACEKGAQLLCAVQLAHSLRPRSLNAPCILHAPHSAWLVDVDSRAADGAQGDGMAQEASGRHRWTLLAEGLPANSAPPGTSTSLLPEAPRDH
eukprot:6918011-Prymnesium_polylepis.1